MFKNEVKIKTDILNISNALRKRKFEQVNKIQLQMVNNIDKDRDYCDEFLKLYEDVKGDKNKCFYNIMKEIVIKSKIYNREELANRR
ncbi:hypothetical protein [Haloimpatiens massiliensis]|uniref:hypothetical protein n=1 Tax=Haloimpatiens massiliensis TaxID=1658110 RepID=UPI000C817711|nr:hypothetical protein [Haloimpatiens massiliensis]